MNKLLLKYKKNKAEMTELEKNDLIREYAPLVKFIVNRMICRLPSSVEYDDLYSVGSIGLLDAIEKYDPEKNIKFETYAKYRIKGAIIDELRSKDWLPRGLRDKLKEIDRAYQDLEHDPTVGEVTDEMVSDRVGMSVEDYRDLLANAQPGGMISWEDLGITGEYSQKDVMDFIEDPTAKNPFDEVELQEAKDAIAGAIESLPEKQQLVVALYYYEELTLKEIGAVLEVTEARASQLHSAAILKLKAKLKKLKDEKGGGK